MDHRLFQHVLPVCRNLCTNWLILCSIISRLVSFKLYTHVHKN